jgi:hypothetical protein
MFNTANTRKELSKHFRIVGYLYTIMGYFYIIFSIIIAGLAIRDFLRFQDPFQKDVVLLFSLMGAAILAILMISIFFLDLCKSHFITEKMDHRLRWLSNRSIMFASFPYWNDGWLVHSLGIDSSRRTKINLTHYFTLTGVPLVAPHQQVRNALIGYEKGDVHEIIT